MAEPELVVRTITVGVTLGRVTGPGAAESELSLAARVHESVRIRLKAAGYSVQTCRVATNPFEEYLDLVSPAGVAAAARGPDAGGAGAAERGGGR